MMRCGRKTAARLALGLSLVISASVYPSTDKSQRPFRVDDLHRIEQLPGMFSEETAFAPDGRAFAFTRSRPKVERRKGLNTDQSADFGYGDIWLQSQPGSQPVNLTNGAKDESLWHNPRWSPDGGTLAMLKIERDAYGVWVWNARTKRLRELVKDGAHRFEWVDAQRLAIEIFPEKTQHWSHNNPDTLRVAPEQWQKAHDGGGVTNSVLDSGVPKDPAKLPQGKLLLVDVSSARSQTIATAIMNGQWSLSSTRTAVAYYQQRKFYPPAADEPLRTSPNHYALEVVTLEGQKLLATEKSPEDVTLDSVRWSVDGKRLAFRAFPVSGDRSKESPSLYRFELATRKLELLAPGDLEFRGVQPVWSEAGDLLVHAAERGANRRDVWRLRSDGTWECLTRSLSNVSGSLLRVRGSRVADVADGDLWVIEPGVEPVNLTSDFQPTIARVAWSDPAASHESKVIVIAQTEGDSQIRYYSVDLQSRNVAPIAAPAESAFFGTYSAASDHAVFYDNARTASTIWRVARGQSKPEPVLITNTFLAGIAQADFKWLEYRSLNGEPLHALMVLPLNHEAGKRYPLLTRVYSSETYMPGTGYERYESVAYPGYMNAQILAAQGYAVLMPSMPIAPGKIADAWLELPNGVLPAVEKAIAEGIADPDRLFVMGQSFGGFSTYGLIEQTTRFKAAVAAAGISDWVSMYGTMDARVRYLDSATEGSNTSQFYAENVGQVRLGSPPWKDFGRYVRNSPISYVDRIQTPLLILQGDMDFVPIEQGEQMFRSLYRQGKRAQFVRYWGEGHTIDSPANSRDMWARIFAWFDEHGDIARGASGELLFDGDHVKSRGGAPALKPDDYLKFNSFFESGR